MPSYSVAMIMVKKFAYSLWAHMRKISHFRLDSRPNVRKYSHMATGIDDTQLTRRERQIMEVIFARGEATAREILETIPDPPGYSSVRKLLGILVEKGRLKQRTEGKRLVYSATQARGRAARGAMQKLLDVFYGGSVEEAVSGLISLKKSELDGEQLARLAALIEQAQSETESRTPNSKSGRNPE